MTKQGKFIKVFIVAENTIAFLYRNQQFMQVLPAGEHRLWDFSNTLTMKQFAANSMYYSDADSFYLIKTYPEVAELVHVWRLGNDELGLLYIDGQLCGVVAPGEILHLWKSAGEFRLDKVALTGDLEVARSVLEEIKHRGKNDSTKLIATKSSVKRAPVAMVEVKPQHASLLYVDGKFMRTLGAGTYGFWQLSNTVTVKDFDLRSRNQEVSGQDILTKDRVTVRVNLSATVKTLDPVIAAEQVENLDEYIYKSLQLALREVVGTKTLDALLEDKLYVNQTVKALVEQELHSVGVRLERVGVKDIILPGEIKAILNQVVEAQKAAEANVIKRREETAATRSLQNTAKMMENNPTLLRLKELESLEKVSEKVSNLNVYGGVDQLLRETVKLT
ncbi:slipin family protein [Aliiglaciecola sp. 2_MG-2023]|uniref:slipin family protein n=1 Tax=unclassified Aliiglaciecola TaxID=2593648 RepID=UPI0026E47C52|nr:MULTISPECIES: slipin family protein [unclassified Aliiglaciecola]MDO6712940.1 slipin family protein [Aliiglaciecola sp. 2_MG-2023]MDO6753979.1 slipin family protein [Aliiglaciecola sp. 1_MG-2023]